MSPYPSWSQKPLHLLRWLWNMALFSLFLYIKVCGSYCITQAKLYLIDKCHVLIFLLILFFFGSNNCWLSRMTSLQKVSFFEERFSKLSVLHWAIKLHPLPTEIVDVKKGNDHWVHTPPNTYCMILTQTHSAFIEWIQGHMYCLHVFFLRFSQENY